MSWQGYRVTDPPMRDDPGVARTDPNWRAISLIRERLHDKYQWARDMGVTEGDTYTELTGDAIAEFQSRAGIPVLVDDGGHGIADYRTRVRLGSYPPPPPPRHAILTFRGTGGIVGQDYTSRVAQLCSDVAEEIPIDYPASMGGIPPGAWGTPSGKDAVNIAVDTAAEWIRSTDRTFILSGYSLGAIAASRVRAMLLPGGELEAHADRYVCGVMLGNPARRFGHTFYLGPIPGGEGIADWHLPQEACTWDWLEAADPGDMYANTPLGDVGDVIRAVYRIVMDTEVTDPIGTVWRMLPHLLNLLDEAGIELPFFIPGLITDAVAGLLASFLPGIPEAFSGGETGAAVQAAIIALRFYADNPPTANHISYEHREAIPGMTYLDLAAQHCRDWATQTAVQTAA